MDWPGCRYWRELVDQFPEAKVILTIRDFDSWYKSARTTIYNYDKRLEQKHRRFSWLRILRPRDFAWNQLAEILWGELGNFKGQFEDKEKARNIFQKHIEEVMLLVVTSLDKVTMWVLGTSISNAKGRDHASLTKPPAVVSQVLCSLLDHVCMSVVVDSRFCNLK